eukprot:scaffold96655_cov35-Phaeocystis_antarctica.AAC.1
MRASRRRRGTPEPPRRLVQRVCAARRRATSRALAGLAPGPASQRRLRLPSPRRESLPVPAPCSRGRPARRPSSHQSATGSCRD